MENKLTPLQSEYVKKIAMVTAGCLAVSVSFKEFQNTVEKVAELLKRLEVSNG